MANTPDPPLTYILAQTTERTYKLGICWEYLFTSARQRAHRCTHKYTHSNAHTHTRKPTHSWKLLSSRIPTAVFQLVPCYLFRPLSSCSSLYPSLRLLKSSESWRSFSVWSPFIILCSLQNVPQGLHRTVFQLSMIHTCHFQLLIPSVIMCVCVCFCTCLHACPFMYICADVNVQTI